MKKICWAIIILILFSYCRFIAANFIYAVEKIDELQSQIKTKNQEIEEIEKEIEKYQAEIDKVSGEKATLNTQIRQLEATASKLKSEISLTQKKISSASFTLEKINLEIESKSQQIEDNRNVLAEIIRLLEEEESRPTIEIVLGHNDLSDFFNNLEKMDYLQKGISDNLKSLRSLKKDLEEKQVEKNQEKANLESLNDKLADQKNIVEINKKDKNSLLATTKNKESNFKKILDEKLAKRDAFLEEVAVLESQLKLEIDPSSLPIAGAGILKWPLDKVFITQYFGNTPFATQNPQVYGGKGHNGLDFRASVGTPVKASLSGTIEATGNTDQIKGCYSYGKWVLIRHDNGLSTLYAHLSLIKVSAGQTVTTGNIIGYSGATGYATGPHLHFTVYATQGLRIDKFENSINCKNAYIPIADPSAYLNPLSYL